jgi:hypothetical protein
MSNALSFVMAGLEPATQHAHDSARESQFSPRSHEDREASQRTFVCLRALRGFVVNAESQSRHGAKDWVAGSRPAMTF